MQQTASSEKQSKKESQSKKKAARKSTKTSSTTPNGNNADVDRIVIESDAEKEDSEEVSLVMVSQIEGLEASESAKEVSGEPQVQTIPDTGIGRITQ